MKKKFIHVDDLKICYREGGEGKSILVLHGWGIDSSKYIPLLNELEGKYRVIAPDLPGFGDSEPPKKAWGVSDYKLFVLRFLDKVKVDHFYVLAHSFGGRVAIKLGAEDRERIKKMVLTGAAGIKPKKRAKRMILGIVAKVGKVALSLPVVSKLSGPARRLLYRVAREQDYMRTSGIMRPIFTKVVREDLRAYLKDVRSKVLLLWGEDDKMTPVSDGYLMERKMPFAEIMVFKDVGHRLPYEKPKEFSDLVFSFF
jgi:pimeloyl-ACP methyl ester carboxylesterase